MLFSPLSVASSLPLHVIKAHVSSPWHLPSPMDGSTSEPWLQLWRCSTHCHCWQPRTAGLLPSLPALSRGDWAVTHQARVLSRPLRTTMCCLLKDLAAVAPQSSPTPTQPVRWDLITALGARRRLRPYWGQEIDALYCSEVSCLPGPATAKKRAP